MAHVSILHNGSVTHNMTTTVSSFLEPTSDYIPMYMLIICALLLGAAILGLFGNLVLIAATCWQQKSRRWKYGLHYSVIIANIVLGGVWLPSYMTQIVVNYGGHEFPSAVCLANRALFHLCFIAVITGIPFLVTYELCCWSSPSSRSFVDASKKQFVVGGIITAWASGLLAATCVTADYNYSPNNQMCQRMSSWRQSTTTHSFMSIATSVLSLLSGAIMLLLVLTVGVQRHQSVSRSKPKKYCYNNEQCINGSDTADDRDAEGHLLSSQTDKDQSDGGMSPPIILLDSFTNKTIDVHGTATNNASSDEDDDLFDMKMRLRMQKKASAGRRHTVANIGSPFGGPRNSLDMGAAKGSNYQYVRKWSVDIQALQNQLENPKIHTSSSLISQQGSKNAMQNFGLNSNAPIQTISMPQRNKVEQLAQTEGDKTKVSEPLKSLHIPAITVNNTDDTAGSGKDNVTISSGKDSATVGSGKDTLTSGSSKVNDTAGSDNDSVNVGSGKDSATMGTNIACGSTDTVGSGKDIMTAGSGNDTITAGSTKDTMTAGCSKDTMTAGNGKDIMSAGSGKNSTNQQHKPSKKTAKLRKMMLLTLAVNACMFPYIVTQLLVGLVGMRVMCGMCHLTAVICVIQIPMQPLLFAWINRGLRNAVTQLWHQVSQWHCVCYCHIGTAGKHSCCRHPAKKCRHQSVTTVSQ